MTPRSARRLLVAAIAISLLVHLVIALNLHARRDEDTSNVEVVTLEHHAVVIHETKTPPPLPPKPKKTPAPAVSAAPKVKPSGMVASGTGGSGKATPSPTEAPTAGPSAVVASCEKSDVDPAVVATPEPPQIPVDARAEGTSGTTVVKVALDAEAQITGATIAQSSGNSALDVVAVGMARDARYSPALHACKPVAGSYEYSVKFVAW